MCIKSVHCNQQAPERSEYIKKISLHLTSWTAPGISTLAVGPQHTVLECKATSTGGSPPAQHQDDALSNLKKKNYAWYTVSKFFYLRKLISYLRRSETLWKKQTFVVCPETIKQDREFWFAFWKLLNTNNDKMKKKNSWHYSCSSPSGLMVSYSIISKMPWTNKKTKSLTFTFYAHLTLRKVGLPFMMSLRASNTPSTTKNQF